MMRNKITGDEEEKTPKQGKLYLHSKLTKSFSYMISFNSKMQSWTWSTLSKSCGRGGGGEPSVLSIWQ